MSFPYRLVEAITSSQAVQVIFLRFINIGLFAWGLVLYRRLLADKARAVAGVASA